MAKATVRLYGRVFTFDTSEYTADEIVNGECIPVESDALINAIISQYWEPSGSYSGT